MVPASSDLLARLRALDAGARLLAALDDADPPGDVWLVGGAVRDLLLGGRPFELDLVVEGDTEGVAQALAARLSGAARGHEAFGTWTVEGAGLRIDVATARTERYPRPGALPEVRPASLEEDLPRRDFTVNAIAVGLSARVRGGERSVPHALEDLAARRLRVLHDGSFADDPTRLVRLARYAGRLGFAVESSTEALARAAYAAQAPRAAGEARMGAELLLLLGEPVGAALTGLVLLQSLGGEPALVVEPAALRDACALLPEDGRTDLLLLGATGRLEDRAALAARLDAIHLRREDAARVLDAAADPEGLAAALRAADRPSELAALARRRSPEAVALAGALGARDEAERWLGELRHVAPAITGADLLAAGIAEGPELGARLDAALTALLDHGAATREEQLAAALDADLGH